jgi:hypothetical protein
MRRRLQTIGSSGKIRRYRDEVDMRKSVGMGKGTGRNGKAWWETIKND